MSYMSWRQAEQVPLRPRQHGGFETCLIAKLVVSMVLYHLDKCVLKLTLLLRPLCMLHNPTADFLSFFLRPAVLFLGMVIKKPNVVVSYFLVMCHIKRLCVSSIFVL